MAAPDCLSAPPPLTRWGDPKLHGYAYSKNNDNITANTIIIKRNNIIIGRKGLHYFQQEAQTLNVEEVESYPYVLVL